MIQMVYAKYTIYIRTQFLALGLEVVVVTVQQAQHEC